MIKQCPHCKQDFETAFKSDKWCSGLCRTNFKAEAYKARWAAGKPKTSNGATAFRIFSLNGSLNGGVDHL